MRKLAQLLAAAAASIVVRLAGGCAVDDVELAGKACPCVSGFVCDVARNTCVREVDGAPVRDGGERDAPPGGFVIHHFGPSWRTSRSVRWEWEVSGNADEFAEYQVIVGASEDAVRRQDSTTGVFDRRINPELGDYGGRATVAPGSAAKVWTVTDRHPVAKKIFARLIVRDEAGRENVSAIVAAETLAENDAIVLFGDQLVDGSAATPADLKRVTNDCFSSSAGCLQIGKVPCGDAAACDVELGVRGFGTRNLSAMTAESFGAAFVEIAVRGGAAAATEPHADLVLTIGAPGCRIDGNRCRFRAYQAWSFRPGPREFRLVQVPLAMLQLETPDGPGPSLTYEELSARGFRVEGVSIEGRWAAGANIGLDHAHVRW
jgi:hypothetical protein